jgi:circadian clock protein KaiC
VLAENLLLLRQIEYRGELRRVFSVLKMRFSDHARTIREFTVTAGQDIRMVGPAPAAEGLLTGLARPDPTRPPRANPPAPRRSERRGT